MADEKTKAKKRLSGFMILVLVGIILAGLCVFGIILQSSVYTEITSKPGAASAGTSGGRLSLVGSLAAYAGSSAKDADEAANLIGFFWIVLALSVILIIWGIRGMRKKPEPSVETISSRRDLNPRYMPDPENDPDAPIAYIPTPPRAEIKSPKSNSTSRLGSGRSRR